MSAITSIYADHACRHPQQLAIKTLNREVSWRDWHALVRQTANWLELKKKHNKTVGILMENGLPFLQLFAGAAAAGWTAVPLDLRWNSHELEKRLRICSPSLIVTTGSFHKKIDSMRFSVFTWDKVSGEIDRMHAYSGEEVEEESPFYMGFTSGSTGEPKAFIRSHRSWLASFKCNEYDFGLTENECVLIPGALFHSHFLYGAISTLFLGGTVYLLEKFSPSETLRIVHHYPITVVYLVPTMIEALLRKEEMVEKPLTFISSGAKWEKDSKQKIRRLFPHLLMFEFYGAGELSFVTVLSNDEHSEKPDSVGKPCYGVEVEVRTEGGKTAAPYETGKIFVKSDLVCISYIKETGVQPVQDSQGWSTVDDMGYLDEEGFLYIKGREKNMILYGGMNVFPEEIEAVLSMHPKVELAAVVGMKDAYWGEIITAVVKGEAMKQELRKLCKEQLTSYKVPRRWFVLDEFPMTAGGKIARAQLKEKLEKEVFSHL
ncbi:AMP-binding protein [Pseudobacillus wudalianchiensis]|uniref:Acyl-CoA synthetase n=1 Tax=Pseudobacillus wudalianchiensis TaxID=1743143 RepID=A0A1B9B8A3_9BACI|nr:AMP-binding protein [Bacillus wudalianchiensis]OCA92325.1 acyl-CoA synthetase [Bacillus wudalianchiensis]